MHKLNSEDYNFSDNLEKTRRFSMALWETGISQMQINSFCTVIK